MTLAAPDLTYPKLPLGRTIRLSYSTYFGQFSDVLRASWLWLVLAGAFTGAISWKLAAMVDASETSMQPSSVLAGVNGLYTIIFLLGTVSIAVAWHRAMILREHPGPSGSNIASGSVWRYIWISIVLTFVVMLPTAGLILLTSYLFPAEKVPAGIAVAVIIVIVLAAAAASIRLSLLLPARAVGNIALSFKQTWDRTRGNTWRLFWGMLATALPPMLIVILAEAVLAALGAFPNPNTLPTAAMALPMAIASIVVTICYLLIVPIGIGFLSHAYRHFFQGGLQPEG